MAVRKRRKKNNAAPMAALLLLIALAIGAVVYIHSHYYIAMGSFYRKGEPIDLSGKTVSVRQYKEIARRCGDSEIYWDVPIGQWRYDCRSEAIAVGNFPADEIENFAFFPSLRYVDARPADCSAEIMELIRRYPALDVQWNVPVGARRFDSRSEEITVGDFSADEANKLYQMLGKHAGVAQTRQTLDEYIKVIREESKKLRRDDVKSMSGEELNRYLEQLRNAKK